MNMSNVNERVMLFEPGDRVEVAAGDHQGKKGTVAEVKNGKVFVRSDAYPEGKPKPFKPSDLRRLESGELSSPKLDEPASELGELSSLDDVEGVGNTVPTADRYEGEPSSLEFENHPFPMNGNTVPQQRELSSPKKECEGERLGNGVPHSPDLERLEHLIRWYRELCQKDTLCDRWLHEEISETRTRYRLRWREQGRLHSHELTKEEFLAMGDRVRLGQQLHHVDALVKLMLVEIVAGHDDEHDVVNAQRNAIHHMIDTHQPIDSIIAAIVGMAN